MQHLDDMQAELDGVPALAAGIDVPRLEPDGAADDLSQRPAASLRLARESARYALIVRDESMQSVVHQAEQVAPSEATVLIEGESGTGKEILAHYIHSRSRRANGPFVAVNCAAIPEQLLESELFGHEKGAFSGAIERRIGKFEAAHRGTLLLDEIGEMDVRLQAKLLRVLQEREIDRVGGRAPVRVDLRIIATTNRNLWSQVGCGSFREDLYFRLNVASLHIPPLRKRPYDIDALADYFNRKYAAENNLPAPLLTKQALVRLKDHAWPGNVRELENVIHRAVILSCGGALDPAILELPRNGWCADKPRTMQFAAVAGDFVGRSLDYMERNLILSTLEHTGGNRTQAAGILEISIRALRNKLHDYAAAGIAVPAPGSAAQPGAGATRREGAGQVPD